MAELYLVVEGCARARLRERPAHGLPMAVGLELLRAPEGPHAAPPPSRSDADVLELRYGPPRGDGRPARRGDGGPRRRRRARGGDALLMPSGAVRASAAARGGAPAPPDGWGAVSLPAMD